MKKLQQYILVKSVGRYINFLSYVAPKKASKLAYQLFSNPRLGRLTADTLPKILQEAKQETLFENEHQFQTYTWKRSETEPIENKSNETLLLLHGWESNASRWEKLLPHLLKSGYTIIAIDAPAHGLSSGKEFNVPLYATFIHNIIQKYQPKHIIGHSIGGIAAAYYQHHYTHDLEKMILLGAPSDFKIILKNYVKLLSLNDKIEQSLIDYTNERFHINIDDFSGQLFLKNSHLQGIIAHDTTDTVVLYSEAKKLAASWKNAQLITTTGFGHSLHDEVLYQKIAAFLVEA